jgi:hypothetical protein
MAFPGRVDEVNRSWTGEGAVNRPRLTWEQNPSQWHIIKALAELPIIEQAPALMVQGAAYLKSNLSRVLE